MAKAGRGLGNYDPRGKGMIFLGVGWLLCDIREMVTLLSACVCIAVRAVLLRMLSLRLMNVEWRASEAVASAVIMQVISYFIGLLAGVVFCKHLQIAFWVGLLTVLWMYVEWLVAVSIVKNERVETWRAWGMSVILILGEVVVASPVIEWLWF